MIPQAFYDFMTQYWPHVLMASLLAGFGGMVWTAATWCWRRK
jgi:hypothetical protein